jgi:hypothetical protein
MEEREREELATHARTLMRWDAITEQREKGLAEDDDAFEAGEEDPCVQGEDMMEDRKARRPESCRVCTIDGLCSSDRMG